MLISLMVRRRRLREVTADMAGFLKQTASAQAAS